MQINKLLSKHICKYCAYYHDDILNRSVCMHNIKHHGIHMNDETRIVTENDGEDCKWFDLSERWFDRLERVYNLDKRLKDELEYEQDDGYGDIEYVKNIRLYLSCISYDKSNLDNIEDDILEVLNNKAFDGICRFEKR